MYGKLLIKEEAFQIPSMITAISSFNYYRTIANMSFKFGLFEYFCTEYISILSLSGRTIMQLSRNSITCLFRGAHYIEQESLPGESICLRLPGSRMPLPRDLVMAI